jgi:hypothetical protein
MKIYVTTKIFDGPPHVVDPVPPDKIHIWTLVCSTYGNNHIFYTWSRQDTSCPEIIDHEFV